MLKSSSSQCPRSLLTLVVGCYLFVGGLTAQTSLADRDAEVEKLWLAGDLEAISKNWEADSSLFLAPAAPRPNTAAKQQQFAHLLRRLADTQQLLCQPNREAFVWRTLLLNVTKEEKPPDSLELEIRGHLLKFPRLDEVAYNLPDTAMLYFGEGSYHHRKAVRLAVMKAYNKGQNDAVDSLLTLVPPNFNVKTEADSLELAFLQRMHGVQAMATNDYVAARKWFLQATDFCPKQTTGYSPRILLRLDLAHAYRALASYDSAHWQLDTVTTRLKQLTPEILQLKGILHQRRGMTYRSENELRLAAVALQKADEHLSAYPASLSYQGDLMLTRSTLASVRRQRQDWRGAGEAYLRCIELAQARRTPNSLQLLGLNLNYAGVLGLCGDFTDGFNTAQRALELSRERFGETHLYVAVALNTMAENLIGLGRYKEAADYAHQSLAIREQLYPPYHERLIYPNIVLAQLLEEQGEATKAIVHRQRVVNICTNKYGLRAANCREHRIDLIRSLLLGERSGAAAELLEEVNTDFPPNLPLVESDNPAFDVAQLQLAGTLGAAAGAKNPFGAAIERFDAVQFGFDAEEASVLLAGAYGDIFRQQAVFDLRQQRGEAGEKLAWESVARLKYNALWRFRNDRSVRSLLLPSAVQTRLNATERALVTAQSLRKTVQRAPGQINADSLVSLVESVTRLENEHLSLRDSIRTNFPAYARSRFQRPQLNWDELQQQLDPNERVVELFWTDSLLLVFSLSKDGVVVNELTVPEEGSELVDSIYATQSGAVAGSTDLPELLVDLVSILQAFPEDKLIVFPDGPLSRISFVGLTTKNGTYLAEHKRILYGWSLYDLQSKTATQGKLFPVYGVFPEEEKGLPSRKQEWGQLNQLVPVQPNSGQYWMESRSLPPGIWHFATHAYADFVHPDNAFLLLPGEGERLFVSDLRVQESPPPLVVLSACETGTGRWQSGEGANSMARAFARAGARTTLTTLWKIPDAAAVSITTGFYDHLIDGLTQEEALRQAQLDYLASADDPRQRAPRYWAGFVLTGEGGHLTLAKKSDGLWWWLVGIAGLFFWGWGVIVARRRR